MPLGRRSVVWGLVIGALVPITPVMVRELPIGKWTGRLEIASLGQVLNLTVFVANAENGSLRMTLNTGENSYEASRVRFADGVLRFRWMLGETAVECVLRADDATGVFSGACGEGSDILLRMIPPSQ